MRGAGQAVIVPVPGVALLAAAHATAARGAVPEAGASAAADRRPVAPGAVTSSSALPLVRLSPPPGNGPVAGTAVLPAWSPSALALAR